jgi:hypothetical protein
MILSIPKIINFKDAPFMNMQPSKNKENEYHNQFFYQIEYNPLHKENDPFPKPLPIISNS